MTLEVQSVHSLKGKTPLTKLQHLHKTICGGNLPVHLVKNDLLITPPVIDELMRFDVQTFDQWQDCPDRRAMLQLMKSQVNGPTRSSVHDSFKEKTKVLEDAVVLFFLLVRGETVDTNDPSFLAV